MGRVHCIVFAACSFACSEPAVECSSSSECPPGAACEDHTCVAAIGSDVEGEGEGEGDDARCAAESFDDDDLAGALQLVTSADVSASVIDGALEVNASSTSEVYGGAIVTLAPPGGPTGVLGTTARVTLLSTDVLNNGQAALGLENITEGEELFVYLGMIEGELQLRVGDINGVTTIASADEIFAGPTVLEMSALPGPVPRALFRIGAVGETLRPIALLPLQGDRLVSAAWSVNVGNFAESRDPDPSRFDDFTICDAAELTTHAPICDTFGACGTLLFEDFGLGILDQECWPVAEQGPPANSLITSTDVIDGELVMRVDETSGQATQFPRVTTPVVAIANAELVVEISGVLPASGDTGAELFIATENREAEFRLDLGADPTLSCVVGAGPLVSVGYDPVGHRFLRMMFMLDSITFAVSPDRDPADQQVLCSVPFADIDAGQTKFFILLGPTVDNIDLNRNGVAPTTITIDSLTLTAPPCE